MRLIDADELKRDCLTLPRVLDDEFVIHVQMKDVTKSINNAPTIEAEPVRHGRWEECGQYDVYDYCQCSECGYFSFDGETNYCPYCGAKMDGGDENEDGVD